MLSPTLNSLTRGSIFFHIIRNPKLWYIIEYYSAIKKNKFESVEVRWMNPESVIQGEVSQKEKNKYCILMHISRYIVLKNLFARQEIEKGHRKQSPGHSGGRRGWDELRA